MAEGCCVAGFDDGGRDPEPVNVGSFQRLGEKRKHSFLEPLGGDEALPTP